jgi:hypothetical protein
MELGMVEQFATIVGLLAAFSSGRGAKQAMDMAEFQAWLSEHNHEEIVRLLDTDAKTNTFVKAYLNQQIPEIQSKLDTVIELVQIMLSDRDTDDAVYSGKHYLKGVVQLGLEQIIGSDLRPEDFDSAHSYLSDFIGEHSSYNKYVLEKMIRDSLERKHTASHILNVYWQDLVGFS